MTQPPSGKSEALAILTALVSDDPDLDVVAGDIAAEARAQGRQRDLAVGLVDITVALLKELQAAGDTRPIEEIAADAAAELDPDTAARIQAVFGQPGYE